MSAWRVKEWQRRGEGRKSKGKGKSGWRVKEWQRKGEGKEEEQRSKGRAHGECRSGRGEGKRGRAKEQGKGEGEVNRKRGEVNQHAQCDLQIKDEVSFVSFLSSRLSFSRSFVVQSPILSSFRHIGRVDSALHVVSLHTPRINLVTSLIFFSYFLSLSVRYSVSGQISHSCLLLSIPSPFTRIESR